LDLLDRLVGHDAWATRQYLDLSRGVPDAQLDQPFDIGHQTLRATFEHLIFNIEAWTAMMTGKPHTASRDDRSLADLVDRHARAAAAFAAFARQAQDEQHLDATFIDDAGSRQTLGGTILHVFVHNAEHRSEARHLLERLGVPDLPEVWPQEWEHAIQHL
jgi:uncharacterized damage-inducible protein DinB